MADRLSVKLEALDADRAIANVQRFKSELVSADAQVNALGAKTKTLLDQSFSTAISSVQRQALNLNQELRNISNVALGTKGIDGIGKAAQRAQIEVRRAYTDLVRIEQQAGVTKDPAILKLLQREAAITSAELDRLQSKINRVAAGRSAAAARNAGAPGLDARGLIGSAGAAGVPFATEASIGIDAAAAAGISTGALAAFGAIAAAGVGIVKLSKSLREEAEKRLHVEEAVAIAVNKQIIAGKEVLSNLQKTRAEAEFQRKFQQDLTRADAEQLQHRRELAEQLLKLNPTGESAPRNQGIILDIDARLDAIKREKEALQNASFDSRFTQFQKAQEQRAAAEQKALKDRLESINSARAQVETLGQSVDELFKDLFARRGANNPFVAVYQEAADAIERARIGTVGLTEDLQRQAFQMTANANANDLFAARLDNALKVSDLLSDARGFRSGGAGKPFIDPAILGNPDALKEFQIRQFDNLSLQGLGSSLNFQSLAGAFARAQNAKAAESTVQERLDRQLATLRQLAPGNDAQRDLLNQKIIALTQGLNPADLSESQRNAAAKAREDEAIRLEGAEKAAQAERTEQTNTQKSIDRNMSELLKIAQSDGLTGVIRIINDAEDRARDSLGKRRRARDEDARDLLNQ